MTNTGILVIMDMMIDDARHAIELILKPSADTKQALKRERILCAANRLFVTHGYRKTSVEDIAQAAGVAKGTVYLYYTNKAELLLHAIASEQLQYLTAFVPIFDPMLSARERLHAYFTLGIVWMQKLPLCARLTQGDHEVDLALQELDAPILEKVREVELDIATKLIDAATDKVLSPAELEQRASVCIDTIFALITGRRIMSANMPLEQFARHTADMLVHGIVHTEVPAVPAGPAVSH